MKKFLSVLMALTLLVCGISVFAVSSSAKATELLELESEWEFIVYEETDTLTATAPEGWLDGSDSAEWTEGYAPFAGQGGNSMAVTFFDYANFSAYLRTTFTVEDLSSVKELELNVIYDENPTIYLNGAEIWSADGYQDKDYVTYNISDSISLLKEGENTVCVEFSNVYGGSIFDAYITGYDKITVVDEDGYVQFSGATSEGFVSFGGINDPTNVLDGDQSTVCGSGWNPDVTQAITATFKGAVQVTEIYVQCKNEGITSHEDGMTRGSYDIYLINGETETKINEEPVPALTVDDGGYTITLDEATEATGVKIVITDWLGDKWACLADVMVTADVPAEPEPPVDPTPSEPEPSEPSEEPTPSEEPSTEISKGDDSSASAEESTPAVSEDEDKTSETSKPAGGDKNDDDKGGNSTGLVIGIVAAVIAVIAIVVGVVVVLKKKKA